jgi:hypothetical protein
MGARSQSAARCLSIASSSPGSTRSAFMSALTIGSDNISVRVGSRKYQLKAALHPNNTRLVLPPDSRFFRFFGGPSGAPRAK